MNVVGSVCDAVATNIATVNKLIDPKCLRGNTTGNLLEYSLNGIKIIHYWDAPHLIKSVRNNLLVKDLNHHVSFNQTKYKPTGNIVWNEKSKQHQLASWRDIEDFYKFNNSNNVLFNLIPKITDEHMNPERRKMKVNLATQVFSGTYGRNMHISSKRKQLPNNNCIGTASILLFFNDVFDSLNGDGEPEQDKLTGSINEKSKHFTFWEYAIRMLDTMSFTENLVTGNLNKSNVLKHFMTTIKGMREIAHRLLKLGFESVPLRRGNQDGLENYFSTIRSLCAKPNARDFRCAYSTSMLINFFTDHSLNANCEADKDKLLVQNLKILFTDENKVGNSSDDERVPVQQSTQCFKQEPDKGNDTDNNVQSKSEDVSAASCLEEPAFPENEAQNCISGIICKQLLSKMKCDSCTASVKADGKCVEHEIMRKQSTTAEGIVLPKVVFINSIKRIILYVKKMLPVLCAEKKVMEKILSGTILYFYFQPMRLFEFHF